MTTFNQIDRLKSWADRTGLKDSNQPLYQIIIALIDAVRTLNSAVGVVESSSGSSTNGITALIDDVVATGPGVSSATIQPNVVTYAKIQQVTGLRLVGNPDAATADMVEIPIADGLSFLNGELVVEITPGVPGLLHRLLSSTHYDTVPATPVYGDIIRATEGPDFEGEYYYFTLNAPIVEDFSGIRMGYTFSPQTFVGNYMAMYPPALDFVAFTPLETQLAVEYWDFYMLALLVEDFTGIRFGYEKVFDYLVGNNLAMYPPELSFIEPPSPENTFSDALWERVPVGSEDQVLTVVSGTPEWADLPPPPDDPDYPWVDIPFDAADFTATGGVGPTWTLIAGDLEVFRYQTFPGNGREEDNVRIQVYIRESTVGGTATTQLVIALPFSITGTWGQMIGLQENLISQTDAFVAYDSGISATSLFIQKIPFSGGGPAFDMTANGTFLSFEIAATLA